MKKFNLLALFLSVAYLAVGQLAYTPETSYHEQGTYSSLGTSGTIISTSNKDDANSGAQSIGFNFNFNGTNYTHFVLNTNGFIKLGTSSSMTPPSAANLAFTYFNQAYGGVFNSTSTNDHQILAVFHHDLDSSTTSNTSYRFQTTGSTGNRVCTIEFQNVTDKNILDSSGSPLPHVQFEAMNFQIKLYEANRMIEYVYGNFIPTNDTSLFKVAGVGIKGSNNNQILTANKSSSAEYDMAEFLATNYVVGGGGFNFGNNNNSIGKVIPANVIRPLPLSGKIIRFLPKINNDVEVSTIHSRHGQVIPYGVPYTIVAQVNNVGNNTKSGIWVTLEVTGANSYKDSSYVSSLAAGATIKPSFSGYTPQNLGTDIMRVYTSSDAQPENNEYTWVQKVDRKEIGYADSSNVFRSLGWSGGGGIFACKYHINGKRRIGKIRVKIGNNINSISQQVYGVVADGSGNIIGTSPMKVITASDLTQWMEFDIDGSTTPGAGMTPPPLINNADVLIGFGIPGAFNPLCLQWEKNNRLNTYYYRGALTSGTFSDLGALAGFDQYRMAINARLEGVSLKLEPITSINDPSCAGSNLPFEVTVTNQDSFPIDFAIDTLHLEVNTSGAITQSHTLLVNSGILEPDSSRTFTITNTFDLSVAGQYNVEVEARQWFELDTANNYKSFTVNVVDTPDVSLKVIPDSVLCFNTPFYFKATPYTAGSTQYQWKVNGVNEGPVTINDTFSRSFIDYDDKVMVDLITDHCTTSTFTIPSNQIRMEVKPPPRLINGIVGADTIIENTTKNYITGIVAGNTYKWKVIGGTIVGDSTKSTVKVDWGGPNSNALISLTETGGNCIRTNALPVVIISIIGIEGEDAIGIGNVYPNPANNTVNIPVIADQSTSLELSLYDITGNKVKEIFNGNVEGNRIFSLYVGDLKEGLYFYKVKTSKGHQKVGRLSIKH